MAAMSAIEPPKGLSPSDFEAIEAAVTETARGRWFLAEFARRTRARDTERLLAAMARLERVVESGQAKIADNRDAHHTAALAAVGERLRRLALGLRESGVEAGICEAIESEAHLVARLQRQGDGPRELADDGLPTGAALAAPPQARSGGLIDRIEPMRPPAPHSSASAAPSPEAGRPPREPALSDLDALPLREKLRFFA